MFPCYFHHQETKEINARDLDNRLLVAVFSVHLVTILTFPVVICLIQDLGRGQYFSILSESG